MKQHADMPVWSEHISEWVVSVTYSYEPGETITVLHKTWGFPTQDEALAAVARVNGALQ